MSSALSKAPRIGARLFQQLRQSGALFSTSAVAEMTVGSYRPGETAQEVSDAHRGPNGVIEASSPRCMGLKHVVGG